jgi:hypothetical protein
MYRFPAISLQTPVGDGTPADVALPLIPDKVVRLDPEKEWEKKNQNEMYQPQKEIEPAMVVTIFVSGFTTRTRLLLESEMNSVFEVSTQTPP